MSFIEDNTKKLLLLGGLRYLKPVIEVAHELGLYVVTCDNVPTNVAHQFADEYHNISILDKEAVLALAKRLDVAGILSFAVDPGVLTAAYVAEELGLPFAGSYESVRILQNKDFFRAFLREHGFHTPVSGGYNSLEEAQEEISQFTFPVMVKPVDSAGSKGVARVDDAEKLEEAVQQAIQLSFTNRFIIEEYIEQENYSSDSDCFSLDGKLVFSSFSDQMFDAKAANPYTPAAYVWPNAMTKQQKEYLESELQRLFTLLGLKSSIYNIETRIGKNGLPYIMEVSPRGGGNRIAEILREATGIDLIKAAVQVAVGESCTLPSTKAYQGVWAELILYADKGGIFDSVLIDESIAPFLQEEDLWVEPGEKVNPFTGANETIGILIFQFSSRQELEELWSDVRNKITINVR